MKTIKEAEIFFDLDLKIKKLIESARYSQIESDLDYSDKLLKVIDAMEISIMKMVELAELDNLKSNVESIINKSRDAILNCSINHDRLQSVYEKYILKLSEGLEESLHENLYGYSSVKDTSAVLNKCNTINDVLHMLHFYVINNEEFYKNMNVIEEKQTPLNDRVILCGKENMLSKELFDSIPYVDDYGTTIILSFDDKILIMIRDKGHALSIEAEYEEENIRAKYFIPKVCNIEKVNKLKGVTYVDPKISNSFSVTHGEFVTSKENFVTEMIDFINSVPTDRDMIDIEPLTMEEAIARGDVETIDFVNQNYMRENYEPQNLAELMAMLESGPDDNNGMKF